jgi:hypothetical protein
MAAAACKAWLASHALKAKEQDNALRYCCYADVYRCPYYRFAEEGLYDKLSSVNSTAAVNYWDQLPTAQLDSCDGSFLQVKQQHKRMITGTQSDLLSLACKSLFCMTG